MEDTNFSTNYHEEITTIDHFPINISIVYCLLFTVCYPGFELMVKFKI